MNDKLQLINHTVEAIITEYEAEITRLKSGISSLDQVESYLSSAGITFSDLALQLGYVMVKIKKAKTEDEIVEGEKTEDEIKDEESTGEEGSKAPSEVDMQSLTKQEILDLIHQHNPEYSVSISNVNKDELIAEYQTTINK